VLLLLPWLVALFLWPRLRHLDVGTAIAVFFGVFAVSLGLPTLWLMWTTYRGPKRGGTSVGGLSLGQVADQLAAAVGTQWEAEARVRRLNDPYPLPVSWAAAEASLTDAWDSLMRLASSGAGWPSLPPAGTWADGPDDLAGEGTELVEVLARVPTGRLVVLGEPGTGKTMLMVRLVLDLLARRDPGGSVPILASVASWNPVEQDLRSWLAGQLMLDHPALAGPLAGDTPVSTLAAALLASGLILPVLDGLDEIPEEVRGPAVSRINDALWPGERVVVTCRGKEYRKAVRPEGGIEATIRAAAVVELRLLDADDVRRYLHDDAAGPAAKARWTPVFEVLGTETPAGEALSTPLMVGLARAIYNPRPGELAGTLRDPAKELCSSDLVNRQAVESMLFDAFIPAAYRNDPDDRWKAQDAEKWLVFLAHHLEQTIGGPDLAWWQLRRAVRRPTFGVLLTLGCLLLVGLASALASGWGTVLTLEFASGLKLGLVTGMSSGILLGLFVVIWNYLAEPPSWARRSFDETPSRGMRISPVGSILGLGSGVLLGLVAALGFGFGYNLKAGLGAGLGLGLMIGYAGVLVAGLIAARGDVAAASSPQAVLARDQRAALLLVVIAGLAAGLGAGLAGWLTFGPAIGFGLGLLAGPVTGLFVSAFRTAWPSYMFTRGWLAWHHQLPWSLMSFLADAHERGVLRQAGAVYQFRHIELQHRLANRYADKRQADSPAVAATGAHE
jgi:hypothetical protein